MPFEVRPLFSFQNGFFDTHNTLHPLGSEMYVREKNFSADSTTNMHGRVVVSDRSKPAPTARKPMAGVHVRGAHGGPPQLSPS